MDRLRTTPLSFLAGFDFSLSSFWVVPRLKSRWGIVQKLDEEPCLNRSYRSRRTRTTNSFVAANCYSTIRYTPGGNCNER